MRVLIHKLDTVEHYGERQEREKGNEWMAGRLLMALGENFSGEDKISWNLVNGGKIEIC